MSGNCEQKAICKKVLHRMLGPANASTVDEMSEADCFQQCEEKVSLVFGERGIQDFNALFNGLSNETKTVVMKSENKKEQCKQIMLELFGPVSAARVDDMTDADCVQKCQEKVRALLGAKHADRFDHL